MGSKARYSDRAGAALNRLRSRILEFLYRYDLFVSIKDRLRPIKQAFFGVNDIYYVIKQVQEARSPQSPVAMVLDVGSADGDKTLVLLEAFPTARALCFEPQQAKHQRFYRRIERWAAGLSCVASGYTTPMRIGRSRSIRMQMRVRFFPFSHTLSGRGKQ